MTVNKNFKKQVRARMALTGETYQQALKSIQVAREESAKRYEESMNTEKKES